MAITSLADIWAIMQRNLPRSEWIPIHEIYRSVDENVSLTEEDFEPEAPGASGPKWRRNVRNVLQQKKMTGEIIWLGNPEYLLPEDDRPEFDVIRIPHPPTSVSPEELHELQMRQRESGKAGEDYVLDYERSILVDTGRGDLADRIKHVSLVNVAAGYDILSFDENGNEKYIEVKTTTTSSDRFFLSSNEYRVAANLGDSYWLYFVQNVFGAPIVNEFRDPASEVGKSLEIEPNQYKVTWLGG